MANIVLKDKNGANIVYKYVDYVNFQTLEGGTVRFSERAAEIINVAELPTKDIHDNAVYRVVTKDENGKTTVKFYAHENSGEWVEIADGIQLSDLMVTENGEYVSAGAEAGFAKVTVDIDTFTDVEEFPIENIDQEAVYRVVRQDEETGATHTTYGIFDADDTKTVLEYNAEKGWVECGAGGGALEVDALPTQDIDNEVVYKVIGEEGYNACIWANNLEMGLPEKFTGDYFKFSLEALAANGITATITTYVVDEMPENPVEGFIDNTNKIAEYHCYVIKSTGEAIMVDRDQGQMNMSILGNFHGIISDPSEATEDGLYTILTPKSVSIYGVPDLEGKKKIYKYTEEKGWLDLATRPIEITANGTYDATVGIPGGVGDLEPGAWYVYKHEIPREDIETLYSFANENGELHQWILTDVQDGQEVSLGIVTKIVKIGNEYMLMTNNMMDMGQFYCTAEITYNEKTYPAGWSIVGTKISDSADMSVPLYVGSALPIVMRMPEVIDSSTILGADGMLDFFKTNLLAKKVNREVAYSLRLADTAVVGYINGSSVQKCDLALTPDQWKEPPILAVSQAMAEGLGLGVSQAYLYETAYEFLLFGAVRMEPGTVVENDSFYRYGNMLIYFKDLTAEHGLELDGDFQEGVWYAIGGDPNLPFDLHTYYPAEEGIPPCVGYNPVVVNLPMAELYATQNGVYENPSFNLPINADSFENGQTLQFNENITFSKKVLEQFKEYCMTDSWNGVDYAYCNIYEHYDAYERLYINTYTDGTFDVSVNTIDGFYIYIPEEQIALDGQDKWSSGITTAGWHKEQEEDNGTFVYLACEAPVLTISDLSRLERTPFDLVSAALFGSPTQAAGYSKVTVNVPEKLIASINITENGVYHADAPITFREATVKECKTAGTALYVKEHIELKEETIANILEYGRSGHDYIKDVDCIYASFEYISEGGDARLTMYEDNHYELQMYYWNDTFIYSSLTREWTHQNRDMESPITVSYKDVPVIWVSGYVNSNQFGYGFAPECFNVYGAVDGWNEVNVSVTNGVLNVAALPTENVDTSKVYRISEEKLAGARYYFKQEAGPALTIEETWYGEDRDTSCYHVVDEFPATVEEYDEVTSHGTLTGCNTGVRMAVLRSTGETMMYEPAFTNPIQPLLDTVQGCFGDYPFHGIVESVNDMTEPGFYTLFIKEQVVKGYGIADDSLPIMVYKNGAWVRFVEEVVTPEPEESAEPEATT